MKSVQHSWKSYTSPGKGVKGPVIGISRNKGLQTEILCTYKKSHITFKKNHFEINYHMDNFKIISFG